MKYIDIVGKWWFQESPDNTYLGNLKFDGKSSGSLSIEGFDDNLMMLSFRREKFFILGISNNGRKISLWINHISQKTHNDNFEINRSIINCIFVIDYIFIGIHLLVNDINKLSINSISVKFSGLDKWIYSSDLKNSEKAFEYLTDEFQVTRSEKEPLTFQFFGKTLVEWIGNKAIRHFDIDVIIRLQDESLDNMMIIKNLFQDFLNFVIIDEVNMINMKVHLERKSDEEVEIIYLSTIDTEMKKLKIKTPYIFSFSEIKEEIETIFMKWFELYQKAPTLLSLYFGAMYNSRTYISNMFLMLYQALEVYFITFLHQYSAKSNERKRQMENLVKEVEACCCTELKQKDRIIGLILNGRNLSSKDKISEIFDLFAELLPQLSANIVDKNDFVKKIENYRNRLAHGGIDYDKLDNDDLFWAYKDLQLIVHLCILHELGFTNEDISNFYYLDKIKDK